MDSEPSKDISKILIDLPDVCLRTIVKLLPLYDQLHIGLVCKRMYNIQKSIICGICEKKKSLRIEIVGQWRDYSYDDVNFYQLDNNYDLLVRWRKNPKCENSLYPITLTRGENLEWIESSVKYDFPADRETMANIVEIFPNIECLTLVCLDSEEFRLADLVEILGRFSEWPNLATLKLVGYYSPEQIVDVINRMITVKHLSIEMGIEDVGRLMIYPDLSQFYCRFDEEDPNRTSASWSSYINELISKNHNLATVGFWMEYLDSFNFTFSTELIKILHRLVVRQPFTLIQLDWICLKWHQIKYLDFELPLNNFDLTQFSEILSRLCNLTHLVELHLSFVMHGYPITLETITDDEIFALPQLVSVKRVQIKLPSTPHQLTTLNRILEHAFPEAEQIIFYIAQYIIPNFALYNCHKCVICMLIDQLFIKCQAHNMKSILLYLKNGIIDKVKLVKFK